MSSYRFIGWLWPTPPLMPSPCLMIDWCLHLLDVMFCLSFLLDELLMLDCMCYVHETERHGERALLDDDWTKKIVFFFFNIVFLPIFFFIFVAHDFLDPPTWLSGFFRRLKVLQSDWSVGLTNPSLPHLLAARYVREVSNILRRAVKGQHRSSPWVKLILSHCWALPGVDSATETGKKSRFFPNSVHQWVARSIQTATVGIVSFEHWWYDS